MSISTKQFPLTMTSLSGGPRWSTSITAGANGQESRNANWQDPLWRYNAAYAVKTRDDANALIAFFNNCMGRETPFYLQALSDYKIPDSGSTPQSIGTGNGSTTTFQIKKAYTSGSETYYRNIYRPSATTSDVAVYKGGVLQTYSSNYTYSATTGIITFTSAPGNGVDVSVVVSKFYTVVRFDIDELDIDMLMQWVSAGADYSLHQVPQIPMVEVRDLT